MHFCLPEPDDALLAQWVVGSHDDRENALKMAWKRHREHLLATLKGDFPGLAWQDCEDIAGDTFCILWTQLIAGRFEWQGKSSLINFLMRVARNDANDLLRKRKLRAGLEVEVQSREEDRSPEAPDAWIVRMEWETLRKSSYSQAGERLIACAKNMKRAQRSVGVVMADCWVTNARWPSNERILEVLRPNEPELKLSTVIERRKEVLTKFRQILEVLCQIN
jgi:DNA-directed RNA polymerase specialized sigma24 family protein